MFNFVNRLYGLNIQNFINYSFFYLYSIRLKKTDLIFLKENNIKISYLYNNSFNKKNQVFILYSNLPYNLFNINSLFNIIYNNKIKLLTSLSYNNIYYSPYYYKNKNIKKNYLNWFNFFNYKKEINLNNFIISIKYSNKLRNILLLLNLKYYKLFFLKRFKNIKLI